VEQVPCLQRTLKVIAGLKEEVQDTVPIIGVVISPFSLPVMQMGFPAYFDLMYEQPELFRRLMAINQEFCCTWANAQFKAGATAIGYFDPLASPDMVPPELYRATGWGLVRHCISRFQGPAAVHLGSSRCLPIVDELTSVGAVILGVSVLEDLAQLKAETQGKITLLGNLNGIAMRRWTCEEARQKVQEALRAAASGGGFILSDNHGEIPWQVSDALLMEISAAVQEWGRYPLSL
jgi:uroporphyrinogen decarboxylase